MQDELSNMPYGGSSMTADQGNPNYLESRHEYFSAPDDDGIRLRTVDVWFATKPSAPEYGIVDHKDQIIDNRTSQVTTAWCLEKAGMDRIYIFDRDDINGLRTLLNRIEADFDRRDMDALHASLEDIDKSGEDE